jgi:Cu2+-exporting ATPase
MHAEHDHSGHDHSHHDPKMFKKQFWWALGLTMPTIYFSHTVHDLLQYPLWQFPLSEYVPALFGIILFMTGGQVFLKAGWQEIKNRKPGMMALIAMAIVVAFGYSLFLTVMSLAGIPFSGMDFWWELAALITIMLLGHWIEMSSVMAAQDALGELANLVPDMADKLDGEIVAPVKTSSLRVGDVVMVRPGATIPVDGVVVSGSSSVNESMISGESAPVDKTAGSAVIAGTLNSVSGSLGEGALTIRVTRIGGDTMLAGIMKLVAEAQQSKSATQLLADRAAGWLFYVATFAAMITAVVWLVLGTQTTDFVLERVVTVLVIACPHALGLAIPLVTSISTKRATSIGLLIRDRKQFEALRNVDVVVFDKTGTLTSGNRTLAKTQTFGIDLGEMVALAAAVENYSEHSLAKAVVSGVQGMTLQVPIPEARDFRTIPGVGVTALVGDDAVFLGGPALLTSRNQMLNVEQLIAVDAEVNAGNTVVFVMRNSEVLGFISVGDEIRESAANAVYELQKMRKRVAILSGDTQGVVERIANQLNVAEVFAEVLPHQKAEFIKKLQADGSRVAMVGDGINDAPALAQANVGIAIGSGTDVAIESAGLLLVASDPAGVASAIGLSKRTFSKLVQNLIWGAGYNVVAIPLAAGVLAGLGWVLTPALGAVLMSLSTIIVAANAQLLRK